MIVGAVIKSTRPDIYARIGEMSEEHRRPLTPT